ncbi:MAG: MotA/TolQ/ExbB proton channel family protein [Nitrospirota bacterium]|nr:MotA/TolQ/ExbB proton channel family protein [Nitrospirota bacterium]
MDIGFYLGILFGIGSLVTAVLVDKGDLTAYLNIGAFLIIVGGTLGATVISVGVSEINRLPAILKIASRNARSNYNGEAFVTTLVALAQIARREGLLAIEQKLEQVEDLFLRKGMQMVVDGLTSDNIADIMEAELGAIRRRHTAAAETFLKMGGYAPTMGIIGTVLGLVNMLISLGHGDSSSLGGAVAVAFIATLYGILSANLIFLPIAANLKKKSDEEISFKRTMIEGVLTLHSGESPRFIEEKMTAMLGLSKAVNR